MKTKEIIYKKKNNPIYILSKNKRQIMFPLNFIQSITSVKILYINLWKVRKLSEFGKLESYQSLESQKVIRVWKVRNLTTH